MAVLYIRDGNGNFVPIPAIKGASAYDQAKLGGYRGTEAEFIALLNGLTNSEDATHYTDFNNPHNVNKEQVGLGNVDNTSDMDKPISNAQQEVLVEMADRISTVGGNIAGHEADRSNPHAVTAEQAGAIPEVYYASDDLNTELQQGGNKMTVCNYHSGTLNSPYKEGLTAFAHGMVITNANSAQYGTQLCMPSGDKYIYIRRLNGQGISPWSKVADANEIQEALSKKMSIASGSYRGTGTYGVSKPNTLTFDFVPKFVIVSRRHETNCNGGATFIWINPGTTINFINNGSNYWCHPTLEGTTLSWYCAESSAYQLNSSSYDYDYMAWGVMA